MPLPSLENKALTGAFEETRDIIRAAMRIPLSEDAVMRPFTLMGRSAALFYVDGLSDADKLQRCILSPCQEAAGDAPTLERLLSHVLPVAGARPTLHLQTLLRGVYGGDAALICDGVEGAILCDVRGFVKRGVQTPGTETVVLGPQEAFTESLRDNVVLLRRIMRTPALVSEQAAVGTRIPVGVCILYLDGVARAEDVAEVRRRLEGCEVDYVSSIGMLEQLLEDDPFSLVPQMVTTERPDRAASFLLSGQVLLALENAPQMMALPMNLVELFHAPDDMALRFEYGTFLRLLRLLGILLSLLVPALFVALTGFHTEGMPLPLMTSVQEAQSRVPVSAFPATLVMLVLFSLINEASTRVPLVMGGSLGVVSALILGQAVVEADLVSPLLLVLVALSGLGSFVMPDYAMSIALRIAQIALVIAAGVAGYFGLLLCLFVLTLRILSRTSLGQPLCAPFAPRRPANPDITLRFPIWRQRLRGYMANPYSMLRARGRMRGWEKGDE
ncbi:MAG: spore germination protein [Clostridia bacterium]|nr:spore germination protein [Clostridia bacterium]